MPEQKQREGAQPPTDPEDRPWRAEELLEEIRGRSPEPPTHVAQEFFERHDHPVMQLAEDPPASVFEKPTAEAAATVVAPPGDAAPARQDQPLPTAPPTEIPNHTLVRCIGVGGFGQVWLAKQTITEHFRAAKLIPVAKAAELDGLKRLKQHVPDHAHLFTIEEVGLAGDWLYCLMPLADNANADVPAFDTGQYEALNLGIYLKRRGRLATHEAACIGAELAGALHHLHEHGVTHGDVKPANVMRLGGRWRLADYGLLRDLSHPSGRAHTPGYVPPEGPGTPAADQYALGVVLLELLTLWLPELLPDFRSKPIDQFGLDADAPRLTTVIMRATAVEPRERFGSCADMERALRALFPGGVGSGIFSHRGRKRRIIVAMGLGVAGILTAALLYSPVAGRLARALGAASETPLAISLHVDQVRYDNPQDLSSPITPLGPVGGTPGPILERDGLSVTAELSRPAYVAVVAGDTNGKVHLVYPNGGVPSAAKTKTLVYPAEPKHYYELTDGPGAQLLAVVASDQPLPKDLSGSLHWAPGAFTGCWEFDGRSFRRLGETRGEVVDRSAAPEPLVDAARALSGPSTAVSAIAFEVKPRTH